ncbi:hypothetical protein [Burkholderia pyrrocinia]|uniref:hypothetical protein n=1 Tax=Burkholderia pyrrocinia TaxID=60550 RepID=UPI002AB1A1F5|nr:hypothetical protein [Burkholderia pyrrocinia]
MTSATLLARVTTAYGVASFAEAPMPEFVQLSAGSVLKERAHRLIITDVRHGSSRGLIVPGELHRALTSSSSNAFPAEHSRVVDGRDRAVCGQPAYQSNRIPVLPTGERLVCDGLVSPYALPGMALPKMIEGCEQFAGNTRWLNSLWISPTQRNSKRCALDR